MWKLEWKFYSLSTGWESIGSQGKIDVSVVSFNLQVLQEFMPVCCLEFLGPRRGNKLFRNKQLLGT